MWLERLSGHSTPTQSGTPARAYSPAPRRSSHLAPSQRPGLASRSPTSLSLTLSENISTTSLHSPTRATNGSSLRYEQKPPPDVPDPEEVLRDVLGISRRENVEKHETHTVDGRQYVDEVVDFGTMDLEEFLDQNPLSTSEGPVRTSTLTTAENKKQYEDFHKSIKECDEVLQSVESYLASFKSELGQVSAEIENLQTRSVQLNAQLDNRRKVEKLLGPAVEEIALSPATVRCIAEGPMDDNFVKALNEIEARSTALKSKSQSANPVHALEDVQPLLKDLQEKAIERIRDYLVAQIKALRSPNVNAQVIQHQGFLRHKDLYPYLARNHAVLAEEISQAYINTMKWYYSSNFARYQKALENLQLHRFDQLDLLGSDPTAHKRNTAKGSTPQHDAFGIGRRADMLKSQSEIVIPAHLVEESKTYHDIEAPFRSFNQALIDNVSAEYSLFTEVFSTNTFQQTSRKVGEIFEPTFTIGRNFSKQLIENTTDCLGVLLCVRLNQHFAFELQRRKVPVADSYINYTNILLWPRFQIVMDMHSESLKRVPTTSNRGAVAAFSLVGGSDASKASLAPHAVSQRFGQFLHGILSLSTEAGDDEPLGHSLSRLRTEYESLMGKLAKGAGDASKRNRFLYNNYNVVMTIISDTQGRLAEEQKEHFGDLMKEYRNK